MSSLDDRTQPGGSLLQTSGLTEELHKRRDDRLLQQGAEGEAALVLKAVSPQCSGEQPQCDTMAQHNAQQREDVSNVQDTRR